MVQRSFEVGRYRFAVRSNCAAVAEWLDVLSAYESEREVEDAYFSIWVGDDEGAKRGFHILYCEAQARLRTFDLTAIARLFFSELETLLLEEDDSAFHVRLGVMARRGITVLVPSTLIAFLRESGPGAERLFDFPLSTYVSIDLDRGQLLPDQNRLQVPDDAVDWLADLDREHAGTYEAVDPPGRVPIACGFHEGGPAVTPVTRAQLTYAICQTGINLSAVGGRGVGAVAELLSESECLGLRPEGAREMTAVMRALMEGRLALVHNQATPL